MNLFFLLPARSRFGSWMERDRIEVRTEDKEDFQASAAELLKSSPIVGDCTFSEASPGLSVAIISIDHDEAANMCPEQVHGLIKQAIREANIRLAADKRIHQWKILNDGVFD